MRALTIWQPWASLIVGAPPSYDAEPTPTQKPIENRDWIPPCELIGQRVAIHAGKRHDEEAYEDIFRLGSFGPVRAPYRRPCDFPLGAVVGVATLDRVIGPLPPCLIYERRFDPDRVSPAKLASWRIDADGRRWFVGRFGWVFRDARYLVPTVPCKGAQGVWTLPDDVAARVEEQLR